MSHLSSKCLDMVKLFISIDNACYPETLGKMLAINAPWLATTGWGLVKGWLDPRAFSLSCALLLCPVMMIVMMMRSILTSASPLCFPAAFYSYIPHFLSPSISLLLPSLCP